MSYLLAHLPCEKKKQHAWEVESLGHWSPGAQESLMSVVKQQEQGSRTMSSCLGGKQMWMGSQQDVWTLWGDSTLVRSSVFMSSSSMPRCLILVINITSYLFIVLCMLLFISLVKLKTLLRDRKEA